jgi:hypothetical protein
VPAAQAPPPGAAQLRAPAPAEAVVQEPSAAEPPAIEPPSEPPRRELFQRPVSRAAPWREQRRPSPPPRVPRPEPEVSGEPGAEGDAEPASGPSPELAAHARREARPRSGTAWVKPRRTRLLARLVGALACIVIAAEVALLWQMLEERWSRQDTETTTAAIGSYGASSLAIPPPLVDETPPPAPVASMRTAPPSAAAAPAARAAPAAEAPAATSVAQPPPAPTASLEPPASAAPPPSAPPAADPEVVAELPRTPPVPVLRPAPERPPADLAAAPAAERPVAPPPARQRLAPPVLAAPAAVAPPPRQAAAPPLAVVPNAPRVFILHTAARSMDALLAHQLAQRLERRGIRVADILPVPGRVVGGGVRYFRPEDRELARRLLSDLSRLLDGDPTYTPSGVQDFTRFEPKPEPGTLEVWLPTS